MRVKVLGVIAAAALGVGVFGASAASAQTVTCTGNDPVVCLLQSGTIPLGTLQAEGGAILGGGSSGLLAGVGGIVANNSFTQFLEGSGSVGTGTLGCSSSASLCIGGFGVENLGTSFGLLNGAAVLDAVNQFALAQDQAIVFIGTLVAAQHGFLLLTPGFASGASDLFAAAGGDFANLFGEFLATPSCVSGGGSLATNILALLNGTISGQGGPGCTLSLSIT